MLEERIALARQQGANPAAVITKNDQPIQMRSDRRERKRAHEGAPLSGAFGTFTIDAVEDSLSKHTSAEIAGGCVDGDWSGHF